MADFLGLMKQAAELQIENGGDAGRTRPHRGRRHRRRRAADAEAVTAKGEVQSAAHRSRRCCGPIRKTLFKTSSSLRMPLTVSASSKR